MSKTTFCVGATVLLLAAGRQDRQRAPRALDADPFSFLSPTIQITPDERRQLDAGKIVADSLPAHGHELAILAAGAIDVDGDVLISKINNIVDLERGPIVLEIGRFSETPVVEDLATLTLDRPALDDIMRCRPGDCALKLSTGEIERLRKVIAVAGPEWPRATEQEFRKVLLDRVSAYLALGERAIPTYSDAPVDLSNILTQLLQRSPFLQSKMPELATTLERYPAMKARDTGSFLYWSKEKPWRNPIISVTQVFIKRGDPSAGFPEVIVASKEIFSSRSTSGSLSLLLLLRGPESLSARYLVYVNRTWVDGMNGFWRPLVNRFVRREAATVFSTVRARIQGP